MTPRILVIGVGSIGERHVRCFQATGRASLAICETNDALREKIAGQYGIERAFADLDSAIADDPQGAVIATPAPLHIAMASKLAEAGVHLLIEKPLSTGLEGIDELAKLVQRQHVAAMVAYVWRAHPILREMKAAIDSGQFGRPLHVLVQCGQHFPTFRPAYRTIYYRDRALGGGAIQDAMTHMLNAGEWLVGPIDRLTADAAHLALEGVEVEDTVNVLTRQGGVLGCYSLNQHQAPNETSIMVVCQRGTCRLETHNNLWKSMAAPGDAWVEHRHGAYERDMMFVAQANAFLDVMEGRAEPLCSLQEGLQTLRCNLAALRALTSNDWQLIPRE
jgi:predicted dehydrogenase